jgi:hypothetical protein
MNNIIKEFNEISIDFLTQTSSFVGSSYLYKFKLMTRFNSIFAIDLFIQRVLPLKNKIIERDESFFLNNDYTKHGEVDLNIIEKLKTYIQNMSPNSKDIVWKYIELLMKLSMKILENGF